jgi:hypothetical protein
VRHRDLSNIQAMGLAMLMWVKMMVAKTPGPQGSAAGCISHCVQMDAMNFTIAHGHLPAIQLAP